MTLVPTPSIQHNGTADFVYLVKPDSTAELRPVVLGQRQGDEVVVTKGVGPNESVVVTGQLLVRPGGKVRVEGSPSPAPASKLRSSKSRPARNPSR